MELVTEDCSYLFFYGFVYFSLVYLCVQNFVKQRTFLKNNKKGVVLIIISKPTEERCEHNLSRTIFVGLQRKYRARVQMKKITRIVYLCILQRVETVLYT